MPQFFIHRPVFAWVLAIVTMLAGVYAFTQLPVSTVALTTEGLQPQLSGASATG